MADIDHDPVITVDFTTIYGTRDQDYLLFRC